MIKSPEKIYSILSFVLSVVTLLKQYLIGYERGDCFIKMSRTDVLHKLGNRTGF